MKRIARSLKGGFKYIKNLRRRVSSQGLYSAGHYYSPIPSKEDVISYVKSRLPPTSSISGIRTNEEFQHKLLDDYVVFYKDLTFPEKPTPGHRYFYKNSWFSYSDAIFLYCFLRKNQPKKIVEVGSGFSSAVMLDTVDEFFPQRPNITFIEPYPDRLKGLLKETDSQQVTLIEKRVQEVSLDIFQSLQSGDLLFIDSSHVVKCGSDLQFLIFEVLPRLQAGVFVHFHDVFYPFDYPSEWLMEGRYWNENYFLRAFLSWNTEWDIHFFNTYVHFMFGELIKEKMPLCAKNIGGSLYIQRAEG